MTGSPDPDARPPEEDTVPACVGTAWGHGARCRPGRGTRRSEDGMGSGSQPRRGHLWTGAPGWTGAWDHPGRGGALDPERHRGPPFLKFSPSSLTWRGLRIPASPRPPCPPRPPRPRSRPGRRRTARPLLISTEGGACPARRSGAAFEVGGCRFHPFFFPSQAPLCD